MNISQPDYPQSEINGINLKNEKTLHMDIKKWYFKSGDRLEAKIDGKIIDIVREDLLIEVQTQNLWAMKKKYKKLIDHHKIRTVYPMAVENTVITLDKHYCNIIRARKSPKKLSYIDIFDQLIRIINYVAHKNFSLEIILIKQQDIRIDDGFGSWRRKGVSLIDKQLIEVVDKMIFETPDDYLKLLPSKLPKMFTNKQLAKEMNIPIHKITKITYCLKKMNLITILGREKRSIIYSTCASTIS
ncbi:MAG: hypothetical protein HQK51_20175 [Oligoflexia bacterium]|nr:hypothetical protein [Oligoflexia bacterium]